MTNQLVGTENLPLLSASDVELVGSPHSLSHGLLLLHAQVRFPNFLSSNTLDDIHRRFVRTMMSAAGAVRSKFMLSTLAQQRAWKFPYTFKRYSHIAQARAMWANQAPSGSDFAMLVGELIAELGAVSDLLESALLAKASCPSRYDETQRLGHAGGTCPICSAWVPSRASGFYDHGSALSEGGNDACLGSHARTLHTAELKLWYEQYTSSRLASLESRLLGLPDTRFVRLKGQAPLLGSDAGFASALHIYAHRLRETLEQEQKSWWLLTQTQSLAIA